MLIILGGLPGSGKSTIARALARELDAVHIRIDSIEQALRESGLTAPMNDSGYRVGYAIAEDNLKIGRIVIADSVNPWPVTRDAWLAVSRAAAVHAIEVEIVCSDHQEHRRRVDTRTSDIAGLRLPTWQEVVERDYRPWPRATVVIDTARGTIQEQLSALRAALVSAGAREESSRSLRIRES